MCVLLHFVVYAVLSNWFLLYWCWQKLLDFDYGESDEDDDRKEDAGARNSSG